MPSEPPTAPAEPPTAPAASGAAPSGAGRGGRRRIGLRALGEGGWVPAPAPPWSRAAVPALCSHGGRLYAAVADPADGTLLWSTLGAPGTAWGAPVRLRPRGGPPSGGLRPALVPVGAVLWCLYAEAGGGAVHACPLAAGRPGAAVRLPHQHARADLDALAADGRRRVRTAVRRGPGDAVLAEWRLPYRAARPWSHRDQGWLTDGDCPGGLSLARLGGTTWAAHRRDDGTLSALAWSPERFGPVWDLSGPLTGHAPALTAHGGGLWLAHREQGTGLLLACSSPDGHRWSPLSPVLPDPVAPAAPVLASHAGRLYAAYAVGGR
ncbi:hypothetical protein GCM10023329_18280 [Streptomyces sanyensis]|uniref:Uncharacterized protein n=1 Tax=Streptomyces sanyensis TaxID=568869 RepID=A0ABP9A0V9_9ACTN